MRQARNYGIVKADKVAIAQLYAWVNESVRMNKADDDEAPDQVEQSDLLSDTDRIVAKATDCLGFDCLSDPHVTCANCKFAPKAH